MYSINSNNGQSEWSLDKNAFIKDFSNKCRLFDINPYNVKFYSQQDEDKYIIQYLLKQKVEDGTYLEIGGCDGVLYSNTKTLEDHFGFKGILIEPQPLFYKKLEKNRSRKNNELYNCAVTNNDNTTIDFIGNNAEGGVLNNINTNLNKYNWKSYKVQNKKMKDILKDSNFKYIDFMIIDVEGSELSLLKSINYNFPIFCIIIEAHSNEHEKNKLFGEFLTKQGFTFKERQRGNEVWINHHYFRKHKFI